MTAFNLTKLFPMKYAAAPFSGLHAHHRMAHLVIEKRIEMVPQLRAVERSSDPHPAPFEIARP